MSVSSAKRVGASFKSTNQLAPFLFLLTQHKKKFSYISSKVDRQRGEYRINLRDGFTYGR
jgi:hypothetical protein